jgi:hypothetical protein
VDLHPAVQVVGAEYEAASVQLHLPHQLQVLHHLRAHVEDTRGHAVGLPGSDGSAVTTAGMAL